MEQNKTTNGIRIRLSSRQKASVISPIIHSFQIDLEKIFNLIFKSERALLRITQSGFEALSMIKCCLQPTFQLSFQQVLTAMFETLATSFTRSFTRFFAWRQFRISRFVSQLSFQQVPDFCNIFYKILAMFFASKQFQNSNSNSNTTLYTITSTIQDHTWNVSRFPNCSIVLSFFEMQRVCNFGT